MSRFQFSISKPALHIFLLLVIVAIPIIPSVVHSVFDRDVPYSTAIYELRRYPGCMYTYTPTVTTRPKYINGSRAFSGELDMENAIIGVMTRDRDDHTYASNTIEIYKVITTDHLDPDFGEIVTNSYGDTYFTIPTKDRINSYAFAESISSNPSDERPSISLWADSDTEYALDRDCDTCELNVAEIFAGPFDVVSDNYVKTLGGGTGHPVVFGNQIAASTGHTDCTSLECDDIVAVVYRRFDGESGFNRIHYGYYDRHNHTTPFTEVGIIEGIPCPEIYCADAGYAVGDHFLPDITYNEKLNKWLVVSNFTAIGHPCVDQCVFGQFIEYDPLSSDLLLPDGTPFILECRQEGSYTFTRPRIASNPSGVDENDQGYLFFMDMYYRLLRNNGSCMALLGQYTYFTDPDTGITHQMFTDHLFSSSIIGYNMQNAQSGVIDGHDFDSRYAIALGIAPSLVSPRTWDPAIALIGGSSSGVPPYYCSGTGIGLGICFDETTTIRCEGMEQHHCDYNYNDHTLPVPIVETDTFLPSRRRFMPSYRFEYMYADAFVKTNGAVVLLYHHNTDWGEPPPHSVLYSLLPPDNY